MNCRKCHKSITPVRYKKYNYGPVAGVQTHLRAECPICGGAWQETKTRAEEMDKLPAWYEKSYIRKFGDPRIKTNQSSLF